MSGEAYSPQQSEFPPDSLQVLSVLTIPQLGGLEDLFLLSFPSLNWRTWTWEGGIMMTSYIPFAFPKLRISPKPH